MVLFHQAGDFEADVGETISWISTHITSCSADATNALVGDNVMRTESSVQTRCALQYPFGAVG